MEKEAVAQSAHKLPQLRASHEAEPDYVAGKKTQSADPRFGTKELEAFEEPIGRWEIFWVDFQETLPKMSHDACIHGGKGIVSILAVMVPAYMAALAWMHRTTSTVWQLLPLALWLVALILALYVLLPVQWKFQGDCPEEIKSAFWAMVKRKNRCAWLSAALVILGIAGVLWTWPTSW